MNREFLDFVEDILDAMEKAELLIEGVSYEQFEDDRQHLPSVLEMMRPARSAG